MSEKVRQRRSSRLQQRKSSDDKDDVTSNNRGDAPDGINHDSSTTTATKDKHSEEESFQTDQSEDETLEDEAVTADVLTWFLKTLSLVVGTALVILIGYHYSLYIWTLHENRLWFSKIMEVEREISFRTEAGLYYSYYKQMVLSPSISEGLYDLINDNNTESWRTINILNRFNVYQEVFLASVYRIFSLKSVIEPIFFYINAVFALHGVYIIALYVMAWLLSGSWLSGVLAAALYIFNKDDTTRVEYTIPLRESFALPFMSLQMMFITYYLRPHISRNAQIVSLAGITLCSFLFVLTWQFAQFVFLLQAMAFYGTVTLGFVPLCKIRYLLGAQVVSIILVCVLQFFNKMLLGALVLSFIPAALIVLHLQARFNVRTNIGVNIAKILAYIFLVLFLTICFNAIVKYLINLDDDQHIFKFLLAKFEVASTRDFDALLYKCNGAFQFLSHDFFERTSSHLLFPIYLPTIITILVCVLISVLQRWRLPLKEKMDDNDCQHEPLLQQRPELAYHAIQSVFFGTLALTVLRIKYLWTPQMCVLAAVGVGDTQGWRLLMRKIGITSKTYVSIIQHAATLTVIALLVYLCLPDAMSQLGLLREFYDPDTVELMVWINQQTPKTAVFSGSMQLLAGVKLCTGRKLTNHPHYEDKMLREKTRQLYQYYGRRTPKEVFDIHEKIGTDYIILEDSICYARASPQGCRLPDIIDITNGHLYSGAMASEEPGLEDISTLRFCDGIQGASEKYTKYFKTVLKNKTFRVYKLNKDKHKKNRKQS
ncbi:probable C-mannosyltransferase DPY19L3 isoform X2 [Anneissia japonica]|nr:probable C-mannosyltransferase DPY19L3 isoform X2 [Anneissia japonica]XP_033096269.1 probable C-mannosyltransferase DPY19L3 isoform X2 [Anneissia japonica]XP_033096341.1 probable C-mannosyltransferase DPY19L3 isoform X2 [Anneissia japonica]